MTLGLSLASVSCFVDWEVGWRILARTEQSLTSPTQSQRSLLPRPLSAGILDGLKASLVLIHIRTLRLKPGSTLLDFTHEPHQPWGLEG